MTAEMVLPVSVTLAAVRVTAVPVVTEVGVMVNEPMTGVPVTAVTVRVTEEAAVLTPAASVATA